MHLSETKDVSFPDDSTIPAPLHEKNEGNSTRASEEFVVSNNTLVTPVIERIQEDFVPQQNVDAFEADSDDSQFRALISEKKRIKKDGMRWFRKVVWLVNNLEKQMEILVNKRNIKK